MMEHRNYFNMAQHKLGELMVRLSNNMEKFEDPLLEALVKNEKFSRFGTGGFYQDEKYALMLEKEKLIGDISAYIKEGEGDIGRISQDMMRLQIKPYDITDLIIRGNENDESIAIQLRKHNIAKRYNTLNRFNFFYERFLRNSLSKEQDVGLNFSVLLGRDRYEKVMDSYIRDLLDKKTPEDSKKALDIALRYEERNDTDLVRECRRDYMYHSFVAGKDVEDYKNIFPYWDELRKEEVWNVFTYLFEESCKKFDPEKLIGIPFILKHELFDADRGKKHILKLVDEMVLISKDPYSLLASYIGAANSFQIDEDTKKEIWTKIHRKIIPQELSKAEGFKENLKKNIDIAYNLDMPEYYCLYKLNKAIEKGEKSDTTTR